MKIRIFFFFTIVSLLFYIYKIPVMLTFDADQEYYAYKYLELAYGHKPTLLGIETSVGGLFVGPLYTYVSDLVYWIWVGNPLGIYIFTILLASIQAGLTYIVFTKLKGRKTGLIGGFLVLFSSSLFLKAFAPSVINLLYPFGLLFLFFLWQCRKDGRFYIAISILLGLALHIHFSLIVFFLLFPAFLIWYKPNNFSIIRDGLRGVIIILLFALPLLLFEVRHKFFIIRNFMTFISVPASGEAGQFALINNIYRVIISIRETLVHSVFINPSIFVYFFGAFVFIYFLIRIKKDESFQIIGLSVLASLVLFYFYKGPLPDYYFFFLLPGFFLVFSAFLAELVRYAILIIPVTAVLMYIFIQNLEFEAKTFNPYNLFVKESAVRYIKNKTGESKVRIVYEADRGMTFGFNYLLDREKVNRTESGQDMVYQIVMGRQNIRSDVEFGVEGSPAKIGVRRID